jgi:hypothetical protein
VKARRRIGFAHCVAADQNVGISAGCMITFFLRCPIAFEGHVHNETSDPPLAVSGYADHPRLAIRLK